MATTTLYFHSPCFDGVASAVLAWDFLKTRHGWSEPELHAVNYEIRDTWLSSHLGSQSAVVDFLYHPDATFWADHHLTAFLDGTAKHYQEARRDPFLIYNPEADSCAGLLWRELHILFSHRNPRYSSLVSWAEKIDAAKYDSVEEAITGSSPALRIALGFAAGEGRSHSEQLVRDLLVRTIDEVAEAPDVRRRYDKVRALLDAGLDRFKRTAQLEEDQIVVF